MVFGPTNAANFFRELWPGGKGIHHRPMIIGKDIVIPP